MLVVVHRVSLKRVFLPVILARASSTPPQSRWSLGETLRLGKDVRTELAYVAGTDVAA